MLFRIQKGFENFLQGLKRHPFIKKILYPIYKLFNIRKIRILLMNKVYLSGAEMALLKAKKALDDANLFFWLDFGTLLGAIREGDFIKHDFDIDLGMKLEDYSKNVDNALIQAGFRKKYQFEIDDGKAGLEQSFELNGTKIDIFYYQIENDKMWTYVFDCNNENDGFVKPIAQFFPFNGFDKMTFKNTEFNIPKNPEQYLAFHYGEDFMVPKKSWDYKKDSLNTKKSNLKGVMIKY